MEDPDEGAAINGVGGGGGRQGGQRGGCQQQGASGAMTPSEAAAGICGTTDGSPPTLYAGPYVVLDRGEKVIRPQVGDKEEMVSVGRL
jgi:hypothetical protein